MALRIVVIALLFMLIWVGGGIALYDQIEDVVSGIPPGYVAMFLAALVCAPLFVLLVMVPAIRDSQREE